MKNIRKEIHLVPAAVAPVGMFDLQNHCICILCTRVYFVLHTKNHAHSAQCSDYSLLKLSGGEIKQALKTDQPMNVPTKRCNAKS